MAGDFNGYIHHRDDNRFYVVHADTLEVLNGDDLGAAFLDVLFYHSTNELRNRHHNINAPKSWPCDIWVKQDMTTLVCKWMFGSTSIRSLQGRIDWLVNVGMVETKQADRSSPKEYRLNVEFLNKMIRQEKSVVSYKDFCRSANLPDEEGSANLPDTFGKFADPIADPSFIYKSSSIHISNKENSEVFSLPSEENPGTPSVEEQHSEQSNVSEPDITVEDLCLEDPVEVWVVNQLRRVPGAKRPNLKNRAGEFIVQRLEWREQELGISEFRTAFLAWCQSKDDYLVKNKYPLNHFLKNATRYIGSPAPTPRREAQADPEPIAGPRPMVTDHVVTPARPRASDYVSAWNRIVTLRPFNYQPPSASDFYQDPELTLELWEKACGSAQAIIQERGPRVSWLLLEWMLETKPKKRINWRRMADGEYDHMAVPEGGVPQKHKDAGVVDQAMEMYRSKHKAKEKIEEEDEV